jgi:hypothetical protein
MSVYPIRSKISSNAAKSHVRSFTGMMPPQEFSVWVQTIESITDVEEIKTTWKVESIYSTVAPIEKALDPLSIAYTALKSSANTRSRVRQSSWSAAENHQAAVVDIRCQTKFISGILTDFMDPFLITMDTLMKDHLEEKMELDCAEVTAFESADEEGRLRIIEPRWREATGHTNPAVWEQTWHYQKMKELRTLMRIHMMTSVEEVHVKVKESIKQLHDVLK